MTTYTPAEASALSGFSIDTLRYYEREGVLGEVQRTAGGRRIYTDAELGLLDFLRCLRETGMPVERLRRYGELCRRDDTLPDRIALLEQHAEHVERQLQDVLTQKARLSEKIAWYRGELDAGRSRSDAQPGSV